MLELLIFVWRYILKDFINKQYNKKTTKLIFLFVIAMVLAYLAGYFYACLVSGQIVPFKVFYNVAFTITDAENYLKIAENGYVTDGIDKYALVFFPMFPLLIRILHTITFLDYPVCSFIISFTSACTSVVLMYKLIKLDYSEDVAFKGAVFYIIYPVSSFLVSGLNEALFMTLLLSTVYFVRKKKYIVAGLFGFMVALTRLPGLCVGALMLAETIMYIIRSVRKKKFKIKILFKQCCMMLMTLMGLGVYLLINYVLYEDCFKFFEYQRDIWYQNVSNPLYVIVEVIFKSQILRGIYKIGISNLVGYILVLIACLYSLYKKIRTSYLVYMFVYFCVCYSASWLLSGARYSLGAFVIFLTAGLFLEKHKKKSKLIYLLSFILFLYTSCLCTNSYIY